MIQLTTATQREELTPWSAFWTLVLSGNCTMIDVLGAMIFCFMWWLGIAEVE